jgi:RNA polymerase sigma factor (sigma-70 family)
MQKSVEFKAFEPDPGVRQLIDRLSEPIERKTKDLAPTMLRVMVEKTAVHKRTRVSIALDVPGKTIAAAEESPTLEPAVRGAFAEIERQLDAYKSSRRGEEWWKRLERRKELRELKAGTRGDSDQDFHSAVDPHVSTLTHFARHLVRYAESQGDLPLDELDPEDLVSDVLLRAFQEWNNKERPKGSVRHWLMQLAMRQLRDAIEQARRQGRGALPVEKSAPKTPPSEWVTRLGEEILDFYQPDEALKIEDLLPDLQTPSPEEELENEELRRCVRRALNELPNEQRRALILRFVLGFSGEDLSKTLQKPEPEVERMIEDARTRLRDELTKTGCTFDPHGAEKSPATVWNLIEKQRR